MMNLAHGSIVLALAAGTLFGLRTSTATSDEATPMQLGAFSVSLAVQDLEASRAFYAKLGFEAVGGAAEQNWLVLRNGTTTIGLFQGMFERNILTFNPGWGPRALEGEHSRALEDFEDVRALQARLEEQGVEFSTKADPSTSGPASFVLVDPDGNPILVDQHVPSPASWTPAGD